MAAFFLLKKNKKMTVAKGLKATVFLYKQTIRGVILG
jgi:hypothetical protein